MGDSWVTRDCGTCLYDDGRTDTDQPCVACEYLNMQEVARSHWQAREEP